MATNTIDLLQRGLNAAALRQEAISQNIANVNTPGYKAYRVEFEKALAQSVEKTGLSLKTTRARHIRGGGPEAAPYLVRDDSLSLRTDGNNVDLDLEMAALAMNQLKYDTLVQLTNKQFAKTRNVITGGR